MTRRLGAAKDDPEGPQGSLPDAFPGNPTTSPSLALPDLGAVVRLALPLLTGLALAVPSLAALALALAAVAFFLAGKPVAFLLGTSRKRGTGRPLKGLKTSAALLLGVGLGSASVGVWLGGSAIWPELAFPLAAASLLVLVALLDGGVTLKAELLEATALATLLLPLAAASGANPLRALLAAAVWWLSFVLGTLEVRAIKTRLHGHAKDHRALRGSLLAATLTLATALWLALGQASPVLKEWARRAAEVAEAGGGAALTAEGGVLATGGATLAGEALRMLPPAGAALLPPALAVLAIALLRVHPRHLNRVKWTLMGANALTLVLILQG
jgi:hypothetical protein